MEPLNVEIPASEWREILPLLVFVEPDELKVTGMLRLVADGRQRWWWASDGRRLTRQRGGPDSGTYELLVSPRLVVFAAAGEGADTTLSVEVDEAKGGAAVSVTLPGRSLTVAADDRTFPDVEGVFESEVAAPGAAATVAVDELAPLLFEAGRRPEASTIDDEAPLFWLGVLESGGLTVSVSWPGLGATRFSLQAEATGSRVAALPLYQLLDAIRGLEGEVTVVVPDFARNSIRVHAADRDSLIMPITTTFERERVSTEAVLAEVFGRGVLERDADGDYRLTWDGVPVYARLVDDDPVRIQVFAIAVNGVESSPELLAELNDYNANIGFARCFWLLGQVLVESDLMAGTTEPAELSAAYARVRGISHELGPMLAAVYGGESVSRSTGDWHDYLGIVVEAELTPGTFVPITEGGEWPYEGTVWAVTGDDPMGERADPEANRVARVQLVGELYARGAGVQRARGRSLDGSYADEGFVVWGLDRDAVREIGREFHQEAVFEIDAAEVRVVGCFDDRVVSRPRQAVR